MDSLKFINILFNDLKLSNDKYSSLKFFRKNIQHVCAWLHILKAYHSGKDINIEKISLEINKIKITSRPSVKKIINDGSKDGLLKLETSQKDKRSYKIIPTKQTIDEFEKWKKIFEINKD
ncbi:hypothetical protein N9N46_01080 [Candidatus Pelagibacter ubique]|nr:hypothetical protein [Candidatus Pelagibacter ubique]